MMVFKRRKGQRKGQTGRGTLYVIMGLLVCSALIRLGNDAGQAFASAGDSEPTGDVVAPAETCETPEELREMIAAFQERENRLTSRERALEDRLQALKIADEEVSSKLALLQQAEEDLRATIALADTAAETDLDRLTKVYENMKPKQAATLFEEMDPAFAAGFLGRMRPEAAAEIMAGLSPEAAHTFSVVLAGRNASVPRE
jgi:flagellar motility protein MotE (MotC chaperone)